MRRIERYGLPIVLGVTGLVQFVLVSFTFPLSELWTGNPLFHIDGAWHWYQIRVAENLAAMRDVVGYDPFFNAGYPGGVIYNLSAKFPAALAIVFSGHVNDIVVFKLYSFLGAVAAPLCVALALKWLGFRLRLVALGSAAGFALWWLSLFRWFHTAGMISFVTASFAALAFQAAIIYYLRGSSSRRMLIGLSIAGPLLTFYHPLFPVPIVVATSLYLLFNRQFVNRRRLGFLAVVPVVSALPNLWWLLAMHHSSGVFETGPAGSPYQKLVDASLIWKELFGRWSGDAHGSKLYAPILFAAIWAWVKARSVSERRLTYAFTITGCLLVVMAAVGASISFVAQLEPNRFAPVGYLFLIAPAVLGIEAMIRTAQEMDKRWWSRAFAHAGLALVAICGAYALAELRAEVSWDGDRHYGVRPPEVRPLGPYSDWIVNWLSHETTPEARVLFETSRARIYDGENNTGFYAYQSQREFIGGPYPSHPYMHFAGFWDGRLFDRNIGDISPDEFCRYMELYNVGWIIAQSNASKRYLEGLLTVTLVDQFRELNAYRVNRTPNYFVSGSGVVSERGHNKLVLSSLAGEAVTLKYHYVSDLRSDPPATLLPVRLMDDPNPFIKIVSPPATLRLYLP